MHEIGEIGAGDSWAYDETAKATSFERELASVKESLSFCPKKRPKLTWTFGWNLKLQANTAEAHMPAAWMPLAPVMNHLFIAKNRKILQTWPSLRSWPKRPLSRMNRQNLWELVVDLVDKSVEKASIWIVKDPEVCKWIRRPMPRTEKVILTNMCLIEDGQGQIVMQIRDPERYAWSGVPARRSYRGWWIADEAEKCEKFWRNRFGHLQSSMEWSTGIPRRDSILFFSIGPVNSQEKSAQQKKEKSSGWPARTCHSRFGLWHASICFEFWRKRNYPNSLCPTLEDDFIREFW